MTKKIIGISLDDELLAALDAKRGLIPRSRIVSKILSESLVKE